MIAIELKIKFAGDWVAEIGDYDVHGLGIASTFRNREFFGVTVLNAAADQFDEIIRVIRKNQHVSSVEILEAVERDGRVLCTISTECVYSTYTPMQMISLQGFLPISHSEYRDGYQYAEILGGKREEIQEVISELEYDSVEIVDVTSELSIEPSFSLLEWQQLSQQITADEQQLVELAIIEGFFSIPREISLEELAVKAGIAKSTASKRLRSVEQKLMPLLIRYFYMFYDINYPRD